MDISRIDELLTPEMDALDREMTRVLGTDHPFLANLASRIMGTPGKKLRPKLLILCSKMLGYEGTHGPLFGLVFELVHTATLIHDDIIDEARTRRGKPTLNHELGNTITVLYGDLLYTKAHSTAIETGRIDLLDIVTWVSERMIEGELIQNKHHFDSRLTEETYFDILQRKTAYLFAGTTKAAGLINREDEQVCRDLFDYGFHFGVSFQLMDDYLNFTGSAREMGKPVLSDLRDGKLTLPLIKLLARDEGKRWRGEVERFWRDGDETIPEQLAEAVKATGCLEETWVMAKAAAERAVNHLISFEENRFRHILTELPIHLLHRRK